MCIFRRSLKNIHSVAPGCFTWKTMLKHSPSPLTSQTVYYSLLSCSHGPHGHFLAASFILHVKLLAPRASRCATAPLIAHSCELLSRNVETTWTSRSRCIFTSQRYCCCDSVRFLKPLKSPYILALTTYLTFLYLCSFYMNRTIYKLRLKK